MNAIIKHRINWLVRLFFILTSFFVFQNSIVGVFASPINLGQNHHSPISKPYTYDENNQSVRVESTRNVRANWVASKKEVGVNSKALVNESRVAARAGSRFLKFGGDEAVVHFGNHGNSVMSALGKKSYNLANYIDDANHVIRNGTFMTEMNGYVRLIGGQGSAKYGFVGLYRATGNITTFHIKTAKELSKKAPSLGIGF